MKTTVVTPFDSADFGAFLQAYCLKAYLESEGHTVKHIRTKSQEYVRELYYHKTPKTKREKYIPGVFEKQRKFGQKKYRIFTDAQKCFDVADGAEKTDVMIIGSDEVWDIRKAAFQTPFFWGKIGVPTISYATSIGDASVEEFRFYPDQIQQLKQFKAVLIRDENTAKFVETYTDHAPIKVCDPTILVSVDSYGEELTDTFVENHKCLLVYAHRLPRKIIKEIKAYAKSQGFKTVACCFRHDWCDYQCDCSPLQFSSLIRKCEAVITTTFYGSVFSFLNYTDFVCVSEDAKCTQLLEQFGLLDRILSEEIVCRDSIAHVLQQEINYEAVDSLIAVWRSKSRDALKEALTASQCKDESYDPTICFSDNCTGCFACAFICPKGAISQYIDEQGRTLPRIDMDRCVKCGMCKKVCPQRAPVELYTPERCLAAQRLHKEPMSGSSSGGIGAVLAEHFIKNGHVVVGSVVENGVAVHRMITSAEDLERLKGSKYVQSDMAEVYQDIKSSLAQDKKVLFVGTPCQVAAVRKAFKDNERLFCVDLVCHGVPPQKYLADHIKNVVDLDDVDDFAFRGAPVDYILKLFSCGRLIYQKSKNEDEYYYSFMKGVSHRENCYSCPYAQVNRCGDLTIGDFWKIDRSTLCEPFSGKISLVFINTKKGRQMFDEIRDQLICEEREIAEAVNGNDQLRHPSVKHKGRHDFLKGYVLHGDFNRAIRETTVAKEMQLVGIKRKLAKMLSPIKKVVRKLR